MKGRKGRSGVAGIMGVLLRVGSSGHDRNGVNVPERRCFVNSNISAPFLAVTGSPFLNTDGYSQTDKAATHPRNAVAS
jgi:hypothetical protein